MLTENPGHTCSCRKRAVVPNGQQMAPEDVVRPMRLSLLPKTLELWLLPTSPSRGEKGSQRPEDPLQTAGSR